MKQYICTFQHGRVSSIDRRKETCARCLHAYPHKHTKECDGDHCSMSNPEYFDQEEMKRNLTCQPILNKKQK